MALVQYGGDQEWKVLLKATELYRWTARETRWKRYIIIIIIIIKIIQKVHNKNTQNISIHN